MPDPHWTVLRQNALYLESNWYHLCTFCNDSLCIFSVSCVLDWQFSWRVPLLSFTRGNVWNTRAAPNKARWMALSYLYFRGSGVGVMAFSLVIKCLPNLFTLQSYKLWIFHINEKSPWSPLECMVLFLHFTIGEWGKIGQCVSFFKMAGTEIWPVLDVIQVPTSLPIVGDTLRVHICYVIPSGDFCHSLWAH